MKTSERKAIEKYPYPPLGEDYFEDHSKPCREAYKEAYEEGVKDTLNRVCQWLRDSVTINKEVECNEDGEPLVESYCQYAMARLQAANEVVEDFMRTIDRYEEE